MAQPAERISTVPTKKMRKYSSRGVPREASHSAHSVGQRRSSVPIGLWGRGRRPEARARGRARGGEPQRPQRRPEEEQRADRLVETDQALVGVQSLGYGSPETGLENSLCIEQVPF